MNFSVLQFFSTILSRCFLPFFDTKLLHICQYVSIATLKLTVQTQKGEVSAADGSPMCEDTDSLQEDERHSSSNASASAAVAVAEALIGSVSSFGHGQGHGMHHLLHHGSQLLHHINHQEDGTSEVASAGGGSGGTGVG